MVLEENKDFQDNCMFGGSYVRVNIDVRVRCHQSEANCLFLCFSNAVDKQLLM